MRYRCLLKELSALRPGMIAFSRERNADGEFAPQDSSGPDPAAMERAYGAPAGLPKPGLLAGGAVAATAGALLGKKLRSKLGRPR